MTALTRCCCPGAIARGMRCYIDSATLQRLVVDAFARGLIVAAICRGVLLAARSVDPTTGHSVLYGRRTTALTWALERTAWRLTRLTRFWDSDYYRTYTEESGQPAGYMSVQSEVTRALKSPADFVMSNGGRRIGGSRPPGSRETPRPTRGRHSSSTTAVTYRRAGRAIPTRSQKSCRRSCDVRAHRTGWIGLDLAVFRFDQPRKLLQPVDLIMQDVGCAGVFGVNRVMHRAKRRDGRIDAGRNPVYDLRSVVLVSRESGQAGSGNHCVRPAVRHQVKCAHALGDDVAARAGEVDELVEL